MMNPLTKRIFRELKSDWGKYIVIFLFMIMLISLISGFLVADNSVTASYYGGFTKFNIEDGHIEFNIEPSGKLLEKIEAIGDFKLYNLQYFEETSETGANIRVYKVRENVNLADVMEGKLPAASDEIAMDRMFAQNNNLKVGDTIQLKNRKLTITGLLAYPDYSSLFEKNTDMMFDSINFCVAVMSKQGYDDFGSTHQHYNYAWKYNDAPADEIEENDRSEVFLDELEEILKDYDEAIIQAQVDATGLYDIQAIKDYVPKYMNQAINFTGEDMGSDKAMFILFDYIVIVILAFIFAVTTTNTISQEAGVIGTLRASGYTKGELIRHYMVLPVAVTLIAAVIGNILGYTIFEDFFVGVYYNSYSLCSYESLFNMEAFVDTTVIPIILMFIINLTVLVYKMNLTPLQFLRRESGKRAKKKAFRLNTKIPIMHRFRLRILFQNISAYLTLMIGIFFGGIIVIFGTMFGPLLNDYAELVKNSEIAKYQYLVVDEAETSDKNAEKYCMTTFKLDVPDYKTDDIMVYGIEDESNFITERIPDGEVLVSNGVMDKYGYKAGDVLELQEKYESKTYSFKIAKQYKYDGGMAVFMNRADYLEMFHEKDTYFTGYFSNEELKDLRDEDIYSVITEEDMTKVSEQLKVSMGEFMNLFKVFGALMFLMLMFILTKQIIEKNMQSIAITKILGFKESEIGELYLVMTSIVVIAGLLITIPVSDATLRWAFHSYIYTMMPGYIPYIVSPNCYVVMVVMGILCYGFVAVFMMRKIRKISKSEVLKNVE